MSNRTASRPGWKTDRVERFVALARAALSWERIWPALWPASGILGLYLAAALFDAFALVPGWLHLLILLGAIAAIGALLYRQFRDFRLPDWREGARRLERDSRLQHRPITERDDVLAAGVGDPYAEALWRAHIRLLLGRMRRLRVDVPHPHLAERDPHALRFLVLLVLVAAAVVAGRDWRTRLAAGLTPNLGTAAPTATLDAWINPPAYTGEAPIYLPRGSDARPVSAPVGSKLVLRVHGSADRPRLDADAGDTPPFKQAGGDESQEYAADFALTASGTIAVRADGRTLGKWDIKAVPDSAPVIAFASPPSRTERNAVKFDFTAGDDYGVAKAEAVIVPLEGKLKKPLIVDLPVDNSHATTLKQTDYKDLTEHPYAGLKVRMKLVAIDGAGQKGESKPVTFTLPARVFTNPLARALVEQRRNLAVGDVAAVPKVQRTLDALTLAPDRFYAGKLGVYTAIRAAYWGLRNARVRGDIGRVESLLWQTALALEQGGMARVAEQLRRLKQMLSQALASGAPQSKIDELMQRYKQALDQYLKMMAQNAQQGNGQIPPNAKVISQQDLEDLMKAIQQLAQTGDRQKAAEMLSMLQNLLENLQMSAGGSGSGEQSPQDKATGEAVKKLGDLMGKQRELLDKTYRQGQDAGNPADGGGKGLAKKQGELQNELGQVMKDLGQKGVQAPKSLGEAGRSMGEAQGELGQQDFDNAGDAQKQALEAMRQGAGELARKMEQNGQGTQAGGNRDPLGRQEGGRGSIGGSDVKLPDKSTMERAREILKELRKRAAERGRPQEELDYIDRLLKQF